MRTLRKRFDIVLLDADETIFDFKQCERVAFTRTMAEFGITADDQMVAVYSECNDRCWKALERGELTRERLQSKRYEDFFNAIGAPRDDCALVDERYKANLAECRYLLPGALEFVEKLHQYCAVYIATNGIAYTQHRRMDDSPVRAHIDGMYISEEVGHQKPSKEFFDYIFADLGVSDKSRVCIIGDSLTSDMKGGRNAGITTVRYLGAKPREYDPLCDYEINEYDEFFNILFKN